MSPTIYMTGLDHESYQLMNTYVGNWQTASNPHSIYPIRPPKGVGPAQESIGIISFQLMRIVLLQEVILARYSYKRTMPKTLFHIGIIVIINILTAAATSTTSTENNLEKCI